MSDNLAKSMKQAEGILRSLEEPSEKYARQLAELSKLHAAGAITAEQYAAAEAKIAAKLKQMDDDKSAKKLAEDTKKLEQEQRLLAATMQKAEAALKAWDTPAESYARKLEELKQLHSSGAITAEQYAVAQGRINAKLNDLQNTGVGTGKTTKAFAGFAGVLARLTGNSEFATIANQAGEATEKIDQFATATQGGGAGALVFKAGLVALAAGGGFAIGKIIADWAWGTAAFERSMKAAKEEAAALDSQLKQLASNRFGERREDIELIRNPDEKRAAYQKLFGDLQRDIATAGAVAAKSKRDAEEWAAAWQITGNRKQYAEDAENQAKADKERLQALKDQSQQIGKLIGERAQQNALIAAENAAKEKSESYVESLRKEVEYLAASREEQIKLDAARNTTDANRGEAERLLRERDAIQAKAEAAKELEATQKRAAEEAEKAAQRAIEDANKERQRVVDLEKSIQERIDLKRIELTQGKEAARVQELVNQGIDQASAKRLAAMESALIGNENRVANLSPLAAMESRLLTRGPGRQQEDHLATISRSLKLLVDTSHRSEDSLYQSQSSLKQISSNTSKTTQLVPVP